MCGEGAEGSEEAVHFIGGVVVNEADAEEAAGLFDAEAFGEIEGVVVAVPGEDAAIAEECSGFKGRMIGKADADGGDAFGEARGVGDAEEAQAGDFEEAANHVGREGHFVLADGAVGGEDGGAAIGRCAFLRG